MAHFNSETYFRLVDVLTTKSEFGNIRWEPSFDPGAVQYRSPSGITVILSPSSTSEAYPVTFMLMDSEGQVAARFVTRAISPEDEEPWDARIRRLWELVGAVNDPATILLRELENLSPW